jgi:glyceraldehyde-3-phosphate dehydrogenase (NADP+)
MVKEYPLYIGNTPVISDAKRTIRCPYDQSEVGIVSIASKENIEEAISRAVNVFKSTRKLPSYKRANILDSIRVELENRREELAQTLALECGKNINLARGEVSRACQTFSIASEEAKRLEGEYFPLDATTNGENREALVRYFPIGPVLGITPFNFPLNLVAHKVAPALAVGNPIIIKPSSLAPISAILLGGIASHYVPDGMLSILPCKGKDIEQAVKDARLKMVSFTGSPPVGWRLKEICGKKKICLELGGNAGLIVDKDCNLNYAVDRSIVGAFSYAGQICIHTQRIYAHQNVYQRFIENFVQQAKSIKSGHPLDEDAFLNPMITEEEAIRAENWVREALNTGAKVLCGGVRKGSMFFPTVLTDTSPEMKVEKKEVFAPIVTIKPFSDFEDAVAMVNDSVYGLQTGIFSCNIEHIMYAFENLEVGGVIVNDIPTFRVDQMPYGGVKNSGFGREGVRYTMREMAEMRLMVVSKS